MASVGESRSQTPCKPGQAATQRSPQAEPLGYQEESQYQVGKDCWWEEQVANECGMWPASQESDDEGPDGSRQVA